jgi:pimeloyl-ACP methyl ester carboxylesterase
MSDAVAWVDLDWAGRAIRIEYQWVGCEGAAAHTPLLVFLHEGLGSLAMWKDFPQQLCEAAGCRGLVYSRPGYGRSTPRADGETWAPDFMHRQAHEVLPALLQVLQVDASEQPLWLVGHSDGASIALLYAARAGAELAGLVVMAPHILVEGVTVSQIEQARTAYLQTDLRERLTRYHDDPDSAFWGWNTIWLDARFRDWSIGSELADIACPLLAVQGLDDPYGTLEQIHGIARRVPQTELLELGNCGHSPHRDQADRLIAQVSAFIAQQQTGDKP